MNYEIREFEVPTLSVEEFEDMVANDPDQYERLMNLQRKRKQYTDMLETFKRKAGDIEDKSHHAYEPTQ